MATANFRDMSILQTDATFGNRVAVALTIYCWQTVGGESAGTAFHAQRKDFASRILLDPGAFKPQFVAIAACNQTVANEATTNGTLVGLTTGSGSQLETAALLCTDSDISNAVAAGFNPCISGI